MAAFHGESKMADTLPKGYEPHDVEARWRDHWQDNRTFTPDPDAQGEPFSIVIPPPNVTGALHVGHALNQTLIDVLCRHARQKGKNVLWVPGTDHAGIATQIKVEENLRKEEGLTRYDLGREEFLKRVWDWKHKFGNRIISQLKKLGSSCDWERERFTMDEGCSKAVREVFVNLYNKGLIYKGHRIINWCPHCATALSDAEVEYETQPGKLWHIRYPLADGSGELVVATTRPETIMGDTAMCINPKDPKNQHLRGKKVIVPLVGRTIPVIEDEYVDIEFGTGCLKVTPAHDVNDYMLGEKYHLPSIDIFNDNGTLSEAAGMYIGMDRFDVRKQIEKDLEAAGLLEKIEAYTNKVGYSERTNVVIEPKLSMQWFLKMQHFADMALPPVMNDDLKFYPAKYKNTYRHWMENIKDWCISRQLWWGHRIPAYFLPEGGYVVAATPEEALAKAKEKTGNAALTMEDLRQDEDCLDTWFSSWLWPISLFDGINNPGNEEIKYYYPTSDLVTGPDIIFFWVARMIMAGYEYEGQMPFKNVYFTGIVRDKLGRKMSKSLGNSPDPLELIDKYGADGVRMGMMLSAPAGNDILFDDALCEQGRNFCNKIWNAFRLIKGWTNGMGSVPIPADAHLAVQWFDQRLDAAAVEVADLFSKYRLSEALMLVYKLFWDEFSSWLLEIVKPAYGQPVNGFIYDMVLSSFERLLEMLHPFMPFITEELWQQLRERKPGASLMVTQMFEPNEVNEKFLQEFEVAKEIISNVRSIRLQKNIAMKEQLELQVVGSHPVEKMNPVIIKMCNLSSLTVVESKPEGAASFMIGTTEFAVPLGNMIDVKAEIARMEAELKHKEGFLQGVLKKLSNEKFVNNAPAAVLELERKKQADAESIIKSLKESIEALKKV